MDPLLFPMFWLSERTTSNEMGDNGILAHAGGVFLNLPLDFLGCEGVSNSEK